MTTTYPLPTLAPTISSAGLTAPSFYDIQQSLIAIYQGIYGTDIYLGADSQDGQLINALAKAMNDSNQAMISLWQGFNPNYAQGIMLSSLVKINGMARNSSKYATAVGTVVGTPGTTILGGVVTDGNGNRWLLPSPITIPLSGSIVVTVTAQSAGAITATAGSINQIANPQVGWTSFVNTADATGGANTETDAALRARQAISTQMPAMALPAAILAAVKNVTGVIAAALYENATGVTDVNGVPPHSIALVVNGGNTTDIANAINSRRPPGIQTYGTTSINLVDSAGLPYTINFFVLTFQPIWVNITIKQLNAYTSKVGTDLVASIAAFINSLGIGSPVYPSQVEAAASLPGTTEGLTYYIVSMTVCPVAFNGQISGNVLTVNSMNPGSVPLAIGMSIFGNGVNNGQTIQGLGTGTGGAGTYILSSSQATVNAEQMTAALNAGQGTTLIPFNEQAQSDSTKIFLTVT